MKDMQISYTMAGLILFIATLAGHGLILLSDAVYWDGWMVRGWFRRNDFRAFKITTSQIGLPFFYFFQRFMGSLPNPILGYKVISFICLYISSFLAFCLCREYLLNDLNSLCVSLLMLLFPSQQMTVEPTCIHHVMFMPLFLLACLLGLSAEHLYGSEKLITRTGAVLLFLFSFNLNSLLIYYSGFILLLFISGGGPEDGISMQGVLHFVYTNIVFMMAPFIYWGWKEICTPRHGEYKDLNRIRLPELKQLACLSCSVGRIIASILYQPIRFVMRSRVRCFIVVLSGGLAWYVIQQTMIPAATEAVHPVLMIVFGLYLIVCGSIPYVLVGQGFGIAGWETKNNQIVILPIALVIFGCLNGCLPQKWLFTLLAVYCTMCLFYLNYCYLSLHANYIKNISFLSNLNKIPHAKSYSVFAVNDAHPARFVCKGHAKERESDFPEHRPVYLVYMFEWIWGDVKRIGINEPVPRYEKYSVEDIKFRIKQTTIDFALQDIDPEGRQGSITITAGENYLNECRTALSYLYCKFINKKKLDAFLCGQTSIEFLSLK